MSWYHLGMRVLLVVVLLSACRAEPVVELESAPAIAARGDHFQLGCGEMVATWRGARAELRTRLGQATLVARSWGRVGSTAPVGEPTTVLDGRLRLQRPGLVEWWESRSEGLVHGFDVMAPPSGEGLCELALATPPARITRDGRSATFDAGGQRFGYSNLQAFDALGTTLPAWMEVSARGLSLLIDDRDAVYPITIDPVVTPEDWTVDGDGASGELGSSVAWAGDVDGDGYGDVLVSAPGAPSEVRVYYGSRGGLSASYDSLAPPEMSASFGVSAASAGDVNGDGFADVVVGDHFADDGVIYSAGKAYVYFGSAAGVSVTADWAEMGQQAHGHFGRAVASAGDLDGDGYSDLAVGVPGHDDIGAVFVYRGSDDGLATTPVIVSPSAASPSNAQFGSTVASAGDVNADGFSDLVIGASGYSSFAGLVEIYIGSATSFSGGGLSLFWSQAGAPGSHWGGSVATAGDFNADGYSDIIVGAPYGNAGNGSATVVLGGALDMGLSGGVPGVSGEHRGWSVNCAGDVNGDGFSEVIVGAPDYAGTGRASVHFGGPDKTPNLAVATPLDGAADDQLFGKAVSGAGDINGDGFADVLIGAPGTDIGQYDEGRVRLHLGSAATFSVNANEIIDGVPASGAEAGAAVALVDLDGDGRDDVVVGSPNQSAGAGGIHVSYSQASGPSPAPSNASGFGGAMANAGDVDGNGIPDLVVGSPGSIASSGTAVGIAVVYFGGTAGIDAANQPVLEGTDNNGDFGAAVAGCDLNGDGYSDVIVGAPSAAGGGSVTLFWGSSTFSTAAGSVLQQPSTIGFGATVACAGDTNGDGLGDLLVGDPDGANGDGVVYLFEGNEDAAGPAFADSWQGDSSRLGAAVAGVGDINGDGYDDVVLGAPDKTSVGGSSNAGLFVVCLGSSGGAGSGGSWAIGSDIAGDRLGSAVAPAGDVDADGYGDFLVGAEGEGGTGAVHLYLGRDSGNSVEDTSPRSVGGAGVRFGASLAGGDINGDGFGDVLIGAPTGDGGAYIFYGNNGNHAHSQSALVARAEQLSGLASIAPWGHSEVSSGFVVSIASRTPFGESRAKVQVELKPHFVPFDGVGLTTASDHQDVPMDLRTRLVGLEPESTYKWRARILYDPALAHPQGWSHWMQGGIARAPGGVHVRTVDCIATGPDDTCNQVDENCDGSFDEAYVGLPTDCGVGACLRSGTIECVNGIEEEECTPGDPAADDSSCDGVDDDCDSVLDEDYVSVPTTCGEGPCTSDGLLVCDAGVEEDTCVPGSPLGPDTNCNGIDEDCSGYADDGGDVLAICAGVGGPCDRAVCNPIGCESAENNGCCEATRITGCCESDADCDAPGDCVIAECDLGTNTCVVERPAGCCTSTLECNDGNDCTVDDCLDGTCVNDAIAGCCISNADCDDADDCTFDECYLDRCAHSPVSCANESPCKGDSSCWYSEARLRVGDANPSGVRVGAGEHVPVLQFVIDNGAITADIDALRLTLRNWKLGFSEDESITVSLFSDEDGDGAIARGEQALSSAEVELDRDRVVLSGVGARLEPATETTFLVAVRRGDRTTGAWMLAPLALGLLAVRRRRFTWLAVLALFVVGACVYEPLGLRPAVTIEIADNNDLSTIPETANELIWMQGAPIASEPFEVD